MPKKIGLYYEKRDLNENPLERAEQNFEEAGPAIITRRGAVQRLKLLRNLPLEEFRYAQSVAKVPAKVTLLGPDRIAQRFKWEASFNVYKGLDDFVEHLVVIERQIIAELVKAGCKYIQIDAPGYTAYVDKVSLERMRSRGEDPERNLQRSIDADNAIIAGFSDVTFGIHVCRGNARTIDPQTGKLVPQWHREGSYDAIAEKLFNTLKHKRLLLEYDSDRAGSFEPLRLVPKDKIVVLGLVSTKNSDMETVDDLNGASMKRAISSTGTTGSKSVVWFWRYRLESTQRRRNVAQAGYDYKGGGGSLEMIAQRLMLSHPLNRTNDPVCYNKVVAI